MVSKIDLPIYCSLDADAMDLDASWIKLPDIIDFYLIFEFPEPWARKIEMSDHFPSGLNDLFDKLKTNGKRFKFLCMKPEVKDNEYLNSKIKILYFYKNIKYFNKLEKIELEVMSNQLVNCIEALVTENKSYYNQFQVPDNLTHDIFICTHSVRDQCCGKFGTDIFDTLVKLKEKHSDLRVWSSSHMGGHRVGPTFMEMQSGRFWGFLKNDDVGKIINQVADHSEILNNYRGSLGLGRYAQVVEKSIFAIEGWDWFNHEILRTNERKVENKVEVKIEFSSGNLYGHYTASVLEVGSLVLPETGCGKGTIIPKFHVAELTKTIVT